MTDEMGTMLRLWQVPCKHCYQDPILQRRETEAQRERKWSSPGHTAGWWQNEDPVSVTWPSSFREPDNPQ